MPNLIQMIQIQMIQIQMIQQSFAEWLMLLTRYLLSKTKSYLLI